MRAELRPQPLEWLLLVVGLALVWRYQWTMDDAFVYARYGDNALLMGFGLVYNEGELVEGFSSPLWMLWLLLGRGAGLTYGAVWLTTGLLSFAACWWLSIVIAAQVSPPGRRINLPLAYLATNYAVTSYFTSGLETPLVQLVAFGGALFLLRPQSRVARAILALSPLIRPELTLVFGLFVAFVAWRTRRVPWSVLAWGVGLGLGWLVFRVYYYADLLPNTYYLKSDHDPRQGLWYLINTFWSYHFEVVLVACVGAAWVARRSGATPAQLQLRPRLEMATAALLITGYVVRIGGDAMHYRFLAFPFCLATLAGGGLLEHALAGLPARRKATVFTLITGGVAAWSLWLQPPQRDVHALREPGDPHLVHWISDPGRHRRRATMHKLAWWDEDDEAKRAIGRAPEAFVYDAIEVEGWCTRAHFVYRNRIVHDLGLTDPFLARARVKAERPGHKFGLRLLADDLASVYRKYPDAPGPGVFRRAVDDGVAEDWIAQNLDQFEVIERKMFNEHHLLENLDLAFTFPAPIDPQSRLRELVFSGYGDPSRDR